MALMMLAGEAELDVDRLCKLVPKNLLAEVQEKVSGRLLMVKTEASFVAQVQAFDEDDSADTMEDLERIPKPPTAFADALKQRGLRFLLITYNETETENLQSVVDAFREAGLVRFDCTDDVRELG